jgi:hypothetical protein
MKVSEMKLGEVFEMVWGVYETFCVVATSAIIVGAIMSTIFK